MKALKKRFYPKIWILIGFLMIFEVHSMEAQFLQQDYDFSAKEIDGFYPARREILSKNIDKINYNLNQRAQFFNFTNEVFNLEKNNIIDEFIEQAIAAKSLKQADRNYLKRMLLEDERINRIHPYNHPNEVDHEQMDFYQIHQIILQKNTLEEKKLWIARNLSLLFNSKPTVQNIISLIRLIGLSDNQSVDLVLDLKIKSIEYDIVKNAQQLADLFSEIIPNSFILNQNYFERNSLAFLGGIFRAFISNPNRTRRDFNEARAVFINLRLHPYYELNRQGLATRINLETPNLIANIQKTTLLKLRNRVIELYRQVRPNIDDNSIIRYYLIRTNSCIRDFNAGKVFEGECVGCYDEFTNEDYGFKCTALSHNERNPHHPIHIEDLETSIIQGLGHGGFPILCGNTLGHQHELPIDLEILNQKKITLTDQQIVNFQFGTLLSYHRELLALQGETKFEKDIKYCSRGCEILLFSQDKLENNVIRCPQCDISRCFECEEYAHPGISCEQNKININTPSEYLAPLDSNIRPCPYCLVMIEKISGCNSIVCRSCGNEFNIQLGKPRNRTTFYELHFNGDYNRPRTYLVEGERGYSKERESSFPFEHGSVLPDRRRNN